MIKVIDGLPVTRNIAGSSEQRQPTRSTFPTLWLCGEQGGRLAREPPAISVAEDNFNITNLAISGGAAKLARRFDKREDAIHAGMAA